MVLICLAPCGERPTRVRARRVRDLISEISLVRLREVCALSGRFAAYQTFARDVVIRERYRAAGCLGLFANLCLADGIAAPIDVGESAAAFTFHVLAKHRVVVELSCVRDHRGLCLLVGISMNLLEQSPRCLCARSS